MTRSPTYDLIVIAASAGGIRALCHVLGALPADFPVPIAVVQHRGGTTPDVLPKILQRCTALHVAPAAAGERPRAGWVHIAPSNLHLVVDPEGRFGLTDGKRIRFVLSSANPLFESAAAELHGRVAAVVLTGGAHDATDGVQAVKARGGTVIAQDRATSEVYGMPASAIATGVVDYVLPLDAIGPALVNLVHGRAIDARAPEPA